MEKVIVKHFEKNNLILKNATVVIAVSTGVDSMALLACMNSLKEEYNLKIHIAHVNHQVRRESIDEEEYITDFATTNNLELHIMHLEKNDTENFQSYARSERYKFFFKIMKEVKGDYLLLAHHANDNMETILMRLIRGSSLKGYAGMIDCLDMNDFKIVRPFLSILKEDLIEYVNKHKIKYYEDYSNTKDVYTRNRIRKELIPIIFKEEINSHLKFSEFSNTISEASKIVEEKIDSIIETYDIGNDCVSFNVNDFLDKSNFLQEEILFKLLKKYELSKVNISEIIKLIKTNKKNLKVEFKNSFTVVKEYDKITILNYLLKPLDFSVVIDKIKTYNINDTIDIIVSKSDSNFIPSPDLLWYNSNMLPVVVRSRKPGDKILLESGYKKVKDLLIDLKVAKRERDNILIMEKDDEILAVIGIRKSIYLKKIENNDILINVRSINNG